MQCGEERLGDVGRGAVGVQLGAQQELGEPGGSLREESGEQEEKKETRPERLFI